MTESLQQMLADREALEGVADWLKTQQQTINIGPVQGDHDEHVESSAGWLLRLVNAAIQQDTDAAIADAECMNQNMQKYGTIDAPQLALPAGPVPVLDAVVLRVVEEMYAAKGQVTHEQVKQWAGDLKTCQAAVSEDIYEQCCELIRPLVDAGKLPGSVVESLEMLVEHFASPSPAVAQPDNTAAWESGELGRSAEHAKRAPAEVERQIAEAVAQPVANEREDAAAFCTMCDLGAFVMISEEEAECGIPYSNAPHHTADVEMCGGVKAAVRMAIKMMADSPHGKAAIDAVRAALCQPAKEGKQ